jgi:hypothetical protein
MREPTNPDSMHGSSTSLSKEEDDDEEEDPSDDEYPGKRVLLQV